MDVAVGIVAQRGNDRAQALAERIAATIEGTGTSVVVDEETGSAVDEEAVPVSEMRARDLVVSIGGDGTFLFVAREVGGTPIIGVNLGEVGFLNPVAPEDAVETVTDLVATHRETGSVDGRTVDRLQATGDGFSLEPALNEVVVHGPMRGRGHGADIEIRVDGMEYTESYADGVLVATPTGSTAYNLSEGGPLLQPHVDALVVTQMCARETKPSLVVAGDSEIELLVSGAETAYAIGDGRDRQRLEPPATVTVSLADDPVRIAGPAVDFFEALEKLA